MKNLFLLICLFFFTLVLAISCSSETKAESSGAEVTTELTMGNPNSQRDAQGTIENANNPSRQSPAQNIESQVPTTTIKFKEERYDYGTVKEGDIVEHSFEFINAGDQPLVLQNVRASCGCTTPAWPRDPIMPGEKGFISARFDTRGRGAESGSHQSKTVTVVGNFTGGAVMLTLRGVVVK